MGNNCSICDAKEREKEIEKQDFVIGGESIRVEKSHFISKKGQDFLIVEEAKNEKVDESLFHDLSGRSHSQRDKRSQSHLKVRSQESNQGHHLSSPNQNLKAVVSENRLPGSFKSERKKRANLDQMDKYEATEKVLILEKKMDELEANNIENKVQNLYIFNRLSRRNVVL